MKAIVKVHQRNLYKHVTESEVGGGTVLKMHFSEAKGALLREKFKTRDY
jgi:hypothetical protein